MAKVDGLIDKYGRECMLTGISTDLSFHHIVKKEHGGSYKLSNGGLLFTGVHQYIHFMEEKDKEGYGLANSRIVIYKKTFELYNPYNEFLEYKEWLNRLYLKEIEIYFNNRFEQQKNPSNYNIKMLRLIRREINEKGY